MSESPPLSLVLRQASQQQHSDAENSPFISQLMGGNLDLDAYTTYAANLSFLYAELEAQSLRGIPSPGSENLWDARLDRTASLHNDLRHLGVVDVSTLEPCDSMKTYVEYLSGLNGRADIRLIAHHYTRYLGDLSGGQAIARLVARHYGATDDQLSFYRFEHIADIVRFKESYRRILDGLPLSASEITVLVSEVQRAFSFNQRIFDDLGQTDLLVGVS